MITKDNLLNMLEKSMANEDEFIVQYGKRFLEKVVESDILNDGEKEEIKHMLADILEDTERHKSTINMLIEKVKGDEKGEY